MSVPEYTEEVRKTTNFLYEKVKNVIPKIEWPLHACYIYKINEIKKEKNAVVLAHNYMSPQIFHGIADITGDSLGLAREAVKTEADIIVMCGVYFMAETVKLLNPEKTVIIPDQNAGCSLAESITPKDVRELKKKYPGIPVVTYVNTSAEVKAECDICCTSGNALKIVESIAGDRIIFLPDRYLASFVASKTKKELITWHGSCEVHEKFTAKELDRFRKDVPELTIIAHPECTPEVIESSDYAGSTAQMLNFVDKKRPKNVLMVTECSMSDNIASSFPEVNFIRPCNMCPHMKLITLENVLESLETMGPVVEISKNVSRKARLAVEQMLEVK